MSTAADFISSQAARMASHSDDKRTQVQLPTILKTPPTSPAQIVNTKLAMGPIYSNSLPSIRSTLPPTPPQYPVEEDAEYVTTPSGLSEIFHSALATPDLQVSTPIRLTSLPTPDDTPPTKRERQLPFIYDRSPSFADSFVTAREDMRSRLSDRTASPLDTTSEMSEPNSPASEVSTVCPIERETVVRSPGSDRMRRWSSTTPFHATQDWVSRTKSVSMPHHVLRHKDHIPTVEQFNSKDHLRELLEDAVTAHDALDPSDTDDEYTSAPVVNAIVSPARSEPRRGLRHTGRGLGHRYDSRRLHDSVEAPVDTAGSPKCRRLRHYTSPLPGRAFGAGRLARHTEQSSAQSISSSSAEFDWGRQYPSGDTPVVVAFRTLSKPAKRLKSMTVAEEMPKLDHLNLTTSAPSGEEDDEMHFGYGVNSPASHFNYWSSPPGGGDDDGIASPLRATGDCCIRRDSLHSTRGKSPGQSEWQISNTHGPDSVMANARRASHSHTPLSSFSHWSEDTHAPEVRTATAMNIYPHNNESILVVGNDCKWEEMRGGHRAHRHSAPVPPIVNLIPPTPSDDVLLPSRRPSLSEKALRRSSALLEAILSRHSSRKISRSRYLHPSWRPRWWDEDEEDKTGKVGDWEPLPTEGVTPSNALGFERRATRRSRFMRRCSRV